MCLIADIGGTNARFAIVTEGSIRPQHERTLACSEYPSLVDAINAYLDAVSMPVPETASLAIATPVTDDQIVMTNHYWDMSVSKTRSSLGINSLKVINDYTALALALPHLSEDDYFKVGQGSAVEKQPMAVLGPGTGLGVSGCIHSGEFWVPLQGEGGHVSYGPKNIREKELFEVIYQRYDHISAETLVSGPGLVLLYESIAIRDGLSCDPLRPEEVAYRGLNLTDASAIEALSMLCGMLGVVAGNLALTLGARGGVYIGGGIIPKLGDYFEKSPFRSSFENNGRFGHYLSNIPTCVINARYPALIGAAVAVRPEYSHLGVTSSV